MTPADLQPGDVLLYKAQGFYGRLIALKTWHPLSHVEAYLGTDQSYASRDGVGTGVYPLRTEGLALVCRPKPGLFDAAKARAWVDAQPHQPYGWIDLLQFVGVNVDGKGIVCSPAITRYSRAGDLDPFNGEPDAKIAPFEFSLSPVYDVCSYAVEYRPQGV